MVTTPGRRTHRCTLFPSLSLASILGRRLEQSKSSYVSIPWRMRVLRLYVDGVTMGRIYAEEEEEEENTIRRNKRYQNKAGKAR